ncbi:bifunctional alpha,alpha-trehalose-phosphate synthase (UDP-forming)/trehalose-phosphatase [Hymenobacter metallicola]|uniref:Alpha,alpha-trehalose-phosphate synthase n=1 Tax=Hymenobacter metallicola TaxID=2563114 RepID=A0A4Z0QK56_9BACT|nr:bifunctional alpha,alpha-trehalose-phosphate synthase (UDP-forming)/trehalose-phosphatase [Hymenobacter metallicola]TGE29401.1 bifunctional alpha,alpha-trehalose-phosphate synthase (UDP-forming)/trehalose-phosphatase [Hymenobacter metallicola]
MSRTIIVSNRLPNKVLRMDESLTFQPSEGGLATGLGSIYRKNNNVWIGWPGLFVHDAAEETYVTEQLRADSMAPVFLTEPEIRDYYEGFSNATLWPTFHYFHQFATYVDAHWDAYVAVNEKFCQAVLAQAGPEDTIWVHDYQLLLLPEMLRQARPGASIGFFLHIPFPSYEIFRVLPWRLELLHGILGADLIGFHTFGYMRHFLSAVSQLLGLPTQSGEIETASHTVRVDVFPMGIDYERYAQAAASDEAAQHEQVYRTALRETRVILSIDRLDYTKGIAQRLRAFECLLKRYPEWREQVSLIMVVVPSRDQVAQYAALKEEIDELVGRINAQYRTITWNPIQYFYHAFPLEELAALYRLAEVALVTPLRDGMNLVAKEYVACKADRGGVLILSERAGAARELSDALIINPTSTTQLAEALHTALVMPDTEQQTRMAAMQALVRRYDVFDWTDNFLSQLADMKAQQRTLATVPLDGSATAELLHDFQNAGQRLLLLDYDGTLVPFQADPRRAQPDQELRLLLRALADLPETRVVVISGRDRATLTEWLGDLPLDFIAEHGVWLRPAGDEWQLVQPLSNDWKPRVRRVLELYVARTAGTFIEEKDYSLVWHYRGAQPALGVAHARELVSHLSLLTANTELQVLEGNKVLEIKNGGVSKGYAATRWISQYAPNFVVALGDDRTDEDTFQVLPAGAYAVRVGAVRHSAAHYHVSTPTDVRELLRQFLRFG